MSKQQKNNPSGVSGNQQKQNQQKYNEYRNGAEGFIKWAEDKVNVPIYPEGSAFAKWVPVGDLPSEPNPQTGRSYRDMWEKEKEVFRKALVMNNGRFKHRLIVFCWPRGEGKSFMACLVQLWKFFCWPKQSIMLCANSKDQVKFVHYGVMQNIILNSPGLLKLVGRKNIQEKEIRIKDKSGNVVSIIRSISSFSGIMSDITGYTFSEIFQMKKPDFFEQIDGSLRNVPNAFGVIDSTVSPKEHVLYKLFTAFAEQKDDQLFFHYRSSEKGDFRDYWHPNNNQQQLDSYRAKMLPKGFAGYFLNLWSAGAEKVFSRAQVKAINYLGPRGQLNNQKKLIDMLAEREEVVDSVNKLIRDGVIVEDQVQAIREIDNALKPVSDIYSLGKMGVPTPAEENVLTVLGNMYDTDWAIIAGIDRADPLKTRTSARTILTVMAKGLPGSRTMRYHFDNNTVPKYIYFLLHVTDITDHSLVGLKTEFNRINLEYDGIDSVGAERWGIWDLSAWLEEKTDLAIDMIVASYDKQLACFTELYSIITDGRLKAPSTALLGSTGEDLLIEEALIFDHDDDERWFGSPEKKKKNGVQDDVMYSMGWGIYGGRFLGVDDFRERRSMSYFGTMVVPGSLLGDYR